MLWDTDKLPIIKHVLKLLYIRGLPFGRPVVRGRGVSHISYIEQRSKIADIGGEGGQFSAKNRGRPLWKAPYVVLLKAKKVCFQSFDDRFFQNVGIFFFFIYSFLRSVYNHLQKPIGLLHRP